MIRRRTLFAGLAAPAILKATDALACTCFQGGPGPPASSGFITADFTSLTGKTVYPQLFGISTGGLTNGGSNSQSGGPGTWADVAAFSALRTKISALNAPLIRVNSNWQGSDTFNGPLMLDNLLNNITNLWPSSTVIVYGISCPTKTFAAFQTFTQAFCQYWKDHAPNGYKISYLECENEVNQSQSSAIYNACFSGMMAGAQAVDATIRGAGPVSNFDDGGYLSALIAGQTATTLGLADWHLYQYNGDIDAIKPSDFQVMTSAAAPNDLSTAFTLSGNMGAAISGTYMASAPAMIGEWSINGGFAGNETRTQTNLGAGFLTSTTMKIAAASITKAWGALWDPYYDTLNDYEYIASNPSFTLGAQYYTLQKLISTMPGSMVSATVGVVSDGSVLAWATKNINGGLGMAMVNANASARSGQIALSHWPLSSTGNGTIHKWQLDASNYITGGTPTLLNVTSGLTDSTTLSPWSVTMLSS